MKPLILITNDDGILSPGIRAAAEAVIDFAEVLIVAPAEEQSGMGRSYPKHDDAGIIEMMKMDISGTPIDAYGIHGSPAIAVCHAILEIADRKINLCISGINYGENLGLGLSCSGTIGAALEANAYEIPAIAISLETMPESQHADGFAELSWTQAKRIIRIYTERILREGLNGDISFLNINIPNDAMDNTPVELTRQSRKNYFSFRVPEKRGFSEKLRLQSYIDVDSGALEENSDICCFAKRRNISITPITWDMTANSDYFLL
jgi:5'-nucleotidase